MSAAFEAAPEGEQAAPERMTLDQFLALRDYVRVNGFREPAYFHRCRWQMSNNQRGIIAAELALRRRGNNSRSTYDLPPTRQEVERICAVSVGSLDRAKVVVRYGTEKLLLLAAESRVPLTTAAKVARLSHELQHEFVALVEEGANPRVLASRGWRGEGIPPEPPRITMREARYRYVQESAMRLMADSFDALGTVLSTSEGHLDPALTAEQAAAWRSDLSRRAKSFRRLMGLLKLKQEEV